MWMLDVEYFRKSIFLGGCVQKLNVNDLAGLELDLRDASTAGFVYL